MRLLDETADALISASGKFIALIKLHVRTFLCVFAER